MIQLSIVIPIYNVEKYLYTCLLSIMTQDIPLTDYEVILINDGSSDGSLVIAERFAAQYSNIRLISQENRGLSGARNRGIEEAQGEYIWFIDSDDYIEIDCISVLLEYMISGGLDAMRFNYLNVNEKHEIVALNKNPKRHVHYDPMVKSGANFLEHDLGFACYVWQFIFKLSVIKEHHLTFREGIYFEDTDWLPRVLLQIERIISIDKTVYYYLNRIDSITSSTSIEKRKKIIEDKLFIIVELKKKSCLYSQISWFKEMIGYQVISILSDVTIYFYKYKNDFVKKLKLIGVFPIKIRDTSLIYKLKISLINTNPLFYCKILHLRYKL